MRGHEETAPGTITAEEAYYLFNDWAYVVDDLADGRAALTWLLEAAKVMEGMLHEGGSWDDLDREAEGRISYAFSETDDYLRRTRENPDFRAGDAVIRRIRDDQDERDATDAEDADDGKTPERPPRIPIPYRVRRNCVPPLIPAAGHYKMTTYDVVIEWWSATGRLFAERWLKT